MATLTQLQLNHALLLERLGFRKWATRWDGAGIYTVKHWLCHDQTPMFCLSQPAYKLGFLRKLEEEQYTERPVTTMPVLTYEVLLHREQYGDVEYGHNRWMTLYNTPIRVEQTPNLGVYWAGMWRRIHEIRRLRPLALRVTAPIGILYTEHQ